MAGGCHSQCFDCLDRGVRTYAITRTRFLEEKHANTQTTFYPLVALLSSADVSNLFLPRWSGLIWIRTDWHSYNIPERFLKKKKKQF